MRNLRLSPVISAALFCVGIGAVFGCSDASPPQDEPQAQSSKELVEDATGRVEVARVNGRPVYADCVEAEAAGLRQHEPDLLPDALRNAALARCVDFELLSQEAQSQVGVLPEVTQAGKQIAVQTAIDQGFSESWNTPDDIPDQVALEFYQGKRKLGRRSLSTKYKYPPRRQSVHFLAKFKRETIGAPSQHKKKAYEIAADKKPPVDTRGSVFEYTLIAGAILLLPVLMTALRRGSFTVRLIAIASVPFTALLLFLVLSSDKVHDEVTTDAGPRSRIVNGDQARALADGFYQHFAGRSNITETEFVAYAKKLAGEGYADVCAQSDYACTEALDPVAPMGEIAPGQYLAPRFSDALFRVASVGAVSKPVMEKQFGWHVILLVDIIPAVDIPFEDAKADIKSLVFATLRRTAFAKWTAKWMRNYPIASEFDLVYPPAVQAKPQ